MRRLLLWVILCLVFIPTTMAQAPAAGFVNTGGSTLRLRAAPGTNGRILANLPDGTPLSVYGRNSANSWLKVVTAQNAGGWVALAYVSCDCNIFALPVDPALPVPIGAPPAAPAAPAPANAGIADSLIALGYPAGQHIDNPGAMLQVYYRGQALGNVSSNFSKVGDSMTASEMFMRPFSHSYNLAQWDYLQYALNYFKRGADSFDFISIGAQDGWRSDAPLNPAFAHPGYCLQGEMPLACEYRVMKPSVALIMLGSNDLEYNFNLDYYAQTMETITVLTMEAGVIPVLTTLPRRAGYEFQVFACNDVIRGIAAKYGTPLWEYHLQSMPLENNGLSSDWLHPSVHPGGFEQAANFGAGAERYGYGMRNLGGLMMLDYVWRTIIVAGGDKPLFCRILFHLKKPTPCRLFLISGRSCYATKPSPYNVRFQQHPDIVSLLSFC